VTGDHHDRDGIPLPSGPLEDAAGGGDVVTLQPGPARARPLALPAAELAISTYREVVARVAAAGEPRWLIQGLWPADAYGVLAAQEKAGRTWAALDLAVSVATGRPWLDHFLCPTPGPVLVFLGEGGERATVRRIEAIATAKGVDPDQLAERLRLCFRVPRLAAPAANWPPSKPNSKRTRLPWSSWTRCTWPRPGPVARTCTTWAPSFRPSRASASRRGVRWESS
jgi:AAA domain